MTTDPLVLLPQLDQATDRLLRTAATLGDAAGPSSLPGWTRGHVLTHLARNADAYVNLLNWARTGVRTPAYPSAEARAADIEAGAGRPLAEQVEDVRAAATRFAELAADMPASAWAATIEKLGGREVPATIVVWDRLREVEVHHVDLDAGYTTADWPDAFSQHLLRELLNGFGKRHDAPTLILRPDELGHDLSLRPAPAGDDAGDAAGVPVVAGPSHALAGWLSGRSAGDNLRVIPDGPLPSVPAWM
ncbi:maleylpyruvate isomerase family mycothiol-dependent enzyme [Phytohabitans aurantiacus]|jgi:maleylpyruvate isomerase|uniref:Maleylpyruvate isomerase n=1 Tax=Phytohabitans aurantiacus TaxID=3016789 RepID=A0ABQ5QV65_9ACTN|nr:maleylpyruvate isomerase family mycothiol-dependent enzyme [Phytohabitans aurantiacus]GLH97619.1 maleylpyruvate isomerase [Phytohabitans aurantiacus]